MNNKIEPGTLCMIIGAPRCQANIGKIVTAVRLVLSGQPVAEVGPGYINGDKSDRWLVKGDGLVRYHTARRFYDVGDVTMCAPPYLMPLHPPAEEPSQCARQSKLIPA